MEDAVIDEKFLAWLEIVQEIGVVDGNGGRGGVWIDAEDESIADFEVARGANGACTDGGSLGIEKDGDLFTATGGESAKGGCNLSDELVIGVRHVEAEDIGPAVEKLREGGGIGVLRSEGGDEFGPACEGQFP